MAYNISRAFNRMEIIETSIFTRQIQVLLSDEEYRQLQLTLVSRPDLGPVIPGSGGLRKVRWSGKGHGKRGGVRVIYYWVKIQERILMLLIYAKAEQDDLTLDQVKVLRRIIEEEYP
jgi:mRNA-degrading endonuclease RelE of RelBE toxin-antitoxin system